MSELPDHLACLPRVAEEAVATACLDARLKDAETPFVMRGLLAHWPMVAAARQSAAEARHYLARYARPRQFPVNIGTPGGGERLFYDGAMAMNFRMSQAPLAPILEQIAAVEDQTIYLSSIDVFDYFDGLGEANHLDLGARRPITSIWIGTRTRIAAHNDVPDNVAVCVAGRRRFILFPPDQLANLYPGPLENTPAGRPVSMVDFYNPDFVKFPGFRDALAHALIAELEPGDALFVPSMWWHHVEGLEPFNILVNYWWRDVPGFLGQPEDALLHAILALRDLPEADKARWRDLFDHYVFKNGANVTDHLPKEAQGILAPLTAATAGQIRAKLLRGLTR